MSDQWTCVARCQRATPDAVMLDLQFGVWSRTHQWVPRKWLHADNEVNQYGDHGKLVVALWWAVQEGLEPTQTLTSMPLAVQRTASLMLDVIESHAAILDGRPSPENAICECGECGDDPVGWHSADALRTLAQSLRERL